jgi:hypothetical protein
MALSKPNSLYAVTRFAYNWKGLTPEERRRLYAMTNAATGEIASRKDWRKALRFTILREPSH